MTPIFWMYVVGTLITQPICLENIKKSYVSLNIRTVTFHLTYTPPSFTDPTDPTDLTHLIDPTHPADLIHPTHLTHPTDPTHPTHPTHLTQSDETTDFLFSLEIDQTTSHFLQKARLVGKVIDFIKESLRF